MDAVVALACVGLLLLAFWRIGWWRWFWWSLAMLLVIWEVAAKLVTGKTLSQQYWAWSMTSDWWWVPASLVALGGIGLATHLCWKRWRR